MELEAQIQWVEKQANYSMMFEDGDVHKWVAIRNSLLELKKLKAK